MNVKLTAMIWMHMSPELLTYELLKHSEREQHALEFVNASPKDVRRCICVFLDSVAWRREAFLDKIVEQESVPSTGFLEGDEYTMWLWSEFKFWFESYGHHVLKEIVAGCLIPHRLMRI